MDSAVDLYYLLATDKIDLALVKTVLTSYLQEAAPEEPEEAETKTTKELPENEKENDVLYIGDYVKNINYRFAKCCNPIPGDDVFGFVTTLGGISIHRRNCPNAKRLAERYPYRILEVKWTGSEEKPFYRVNLKINGNDELGIVEAITKTITGDLRVNMRSINFTTKGKKFEGRVSLMIRNHEHLDQLIHRLKQVKGVEKITRVK